MFISAVFPPWLHSSAAGEWSYECCLILSALCLTAPMYSSAQHYHNCYIFFIDGVTYDTWSANNIWRQKNINLIIFNIIDNDLSLCFVEMARRGSSFSQKTSSTHIAILCCIAALLWQENRWEPLNNTLNVSQNLDIVTRLINYYPDI